MEWTKDMGRHIPEQEAQMARPSGEMLTSRRWAADEDHSRRHLTGIQSAKQHKRDDPSVGQGTGQ